MLAPKGETAAADLAANGRQGTNRSRPEERRDSSPAASPATHQVTEPEGVDFDWINDKEDVAIAEQPATAVYNWAKVSARDRMREHGTESIAGARSARGGPPPHLEQPERPATATRQRQLAEPVIVSEFWANRRGEAVRVQLRELVDVRKHFTNGDGRLQATPKGISLAVTRLPELAEAINKAVTKARELGLIGGES